MFSYDSPRTATEDICLLLKLHTVSEFSAALRLISGRHTVLSEVFFLSSS
ncbi:mCG147453 [Mus musculus]|nr:mCG147453 [Mus musculus]